MLTKKNNPLSRYKNGRTVKGVNFVDLRDAGDPELAKIYSDEGADELVFLDISATEERRKTLVNLVRSCGNEYPVTGGEFLQLKMYYCKTELIKFRSIHQRVKNPQLTQLAQKI
jgi:cyclase